MKKKNYLLITFKGISRYRYRRGHVVVFWVDGKRRHAEERSVFATIRMVEFDLILLTADKRNNAFSIRNPTVEGIVFMRRAG